MGEQLRNESLSRRKSKDVDENALKSLMLYDNGLKDTGFAQIIEGMSCLKTVKSLTYFGNELGDESINKLEDLTWDKPHHAIRELRIGYLKVVPKNLVKTFDLISRLAYLEKLRISGLKVTDPK